MTLFSKNGGTPATLPFMDTDADGNAWTNLAENEDGRIACGWSEAPAMPVIDPSLQRVEWQDGSWRVLDRDPAELAAELEELRAQRIADLAAERFARQLVLAWNGQPMPADDVTIGRISAKIAIMDKRGADPAETFTWKPASATFVQISYAQLVDYGDAIDQHVQACFDQEEALCAQLLAATDKATIGAVDIGTGWPA